jgi:hypothetical protein
MKRRSFARCLVATAALLAASSAGAAPQPPGSTQSELKSWLARLDARGIEVAARRPWRYFFTAAGTAPLEALSRELVAGGYAIVALGARGSGAALALERVELHGAATLTERNRELTAVARRHGVRYDGVDIASAP